MRNVKDITIWYPTVVMFTISSFVLALVAQAVTPPPDGGYPGGNTAEGQSALQSLTSGTYNNAVGIYSLLSLTTGSFNTAEGADALLSNTANENTATGAGTLFSNTTGPANTANGAFALFSNRTGANNTAVGDRALQNLNGSGNIALGASAGFNLTTGDNNIDIGSEGVAGESNTIRVGDPAIHGEIFVAGITAMSPAAPNQAVLLDPATGKLGSADVTFHCRSPSSHGGGVGVLLRTKEPASVQGSRRGSFGVPVFLWGVRGSLLRTKRGRELPR